MNAEREVKARSTAALTACQQTGPPANCTAQMMHYCDRHINTHKFDLPEKTMYSKNFWLLFKDVIANKVAELKIVKIYSIPSV